MSVVSLPPEEYGMDHAWLSGFIGDDQEALARLDRLARYEPPPSRWHVWQAEGGGWDACYGLDCAYCASGDEPVAAPPDHSPTEEPT